MSPGLSWTKCLSSVRCMFVDAGNISDIQYCYEVMSTVPLRMKLFDGYVVERMMSRVPSAWNVSIIRYCVNYGSVQGTSPSGQIRLMSVRIGPKATVALARVKPWVH
jgi:hypothetical protein